MINRIALVGDAYGIPELLKAIPVSEVRCIIGSHLRPDYLPELKKISDDIGVPLIVQPSKVSGKVPDFCQLVHNLDLNLMLCFSYSALLPADLIAGFKGQAFNVHASLLPRNRGPNPIQWALIRGDEKTGISLHQIEAQFDTGAIAYQEEIPIYFDDTWVTLRDRIHLATPGFLSSAVQLILKEQFILIPQDETKTTVSFRLNADSPKIDFNSMTDLQVYNLIRAQVAPLSGAYIETNKGRTYFTNLLSLTEIAGLRKKFHV